MIKGWRWFGPKDPITLSELRQIGVEGIVTALHDIPNGEVWPLERILEMKNLIESYGMKWTVAESLPVSEAIKYAGPERDALIENYKISLANMGKAELEKQIERSRRQMLKAAKDMQFMEAARLRDEIIKMEKMAGVL